MFSQYGNFGPLAAEIGPVVWGTLANFNGFRVLAALLQRHRSREANQTLHVVWSYTLSAAVARNGILSGAKFTLRSPSLAFSYN